MNLTTSLGSTQDGRSWTFNLHFQEPLNLTPEEMDRFGAKLLEAFNLHFQEPLNLTKVQVGRNDERSSIFQSPFSGAFESYSFGLKGMSLAYTAFNLHFQEPLNLTFLRVE